MGETILLNPEGVSEEAQLPLAPRRYTSLDGKTVGLLGNSKLNADEILLAVGELLGQRYKLKGIVHRRKAYFATPAPQAIVDELAPQVDVLLAGVGD